MHNLKQPLSIYFAWHYSNENKVKPLVDYCFNFLQKDTDKPFSRNVNIPIFFRNSTNNKIPERKIDSSSEKTLIFIFSDFYTTGDENWRKYYKELLDNKNNKVIPITITKNGFNLDGFERINFIRLYDFEEEYIKQLFFINVAHEIIRILTYDNAYNTKGRETILNLFLSHTKSDDWAVKNTEKIKKIIDSTSMCNFFDSLDINIGHQFDEEIEKHIKNSTVIAIQSDKYSSRYWCQKEILLAKSNNRPIIMVNNLINNEDRVYPHMTNIPVIRISKEITDKEIYNVLEMALLESVSQVYHRKLLESYQFKDLNLLTHPPDFIDINKSLNEKKDILYPEPPIYKQEFNIFENIEKIKIETPLTRDNISLEGYKIGISISEPNINELIRIGHNKNHLIILSQTIARYLLFNNATLLYGGDLRPNGFTEYLCEEAQIVQDRLQNNNIQYLKNYISWPIYKAENNDLLKWKSKFHKVINMIEIEPPKTIGGDSKYDINTFLPPTSHENLYAWSLSLTKMREEMIDKCDFRISAGGRLSGYKGKYPGVLEEIIISIDKNKPLYLIGGFGGVTSKVCDLIVNQEIQVELTEKWQIENNKGYSELVDLINKDSKEENVDYNSINNKIINYKLEDLSINNGLSIEENKTLFKSEFIEEVIFLILKGIKKVIEDKNGNI